MRPRSWAHHSLAGCDARCVVPTPAVMCAGRGGPALCGILQLGECERVWTLRMKGKQRPVITQETPSELYSTLSPSFRLLPQQCRETRPTLPIDVSYAKESKERRKGSSKYPNRRASQTTKLQPENRRSIFKRTGECEWNTRTVRIFSFARAASCICLANFFAADMDTCT